MAADAGVDLAVVEAGATADILPIMGAGTISNFYYYLSKCGGGEYNYAINITKF